MKYLITENNHKPDFAYENVMYFSTSVLRDIYVNSHLFGREDYNYLDNITNDVISNSLTQAGVGKIVIKTCENRQTLYNKNYIIIKENDIDIPEFYFILDIRPIQNKEGEYEIELQKDIFMTYPGILDNIDNLEMIEGHVNDASVFDMVFDAGYKMPLYIYPLKRQIQESFFDIYPNADINILNNQWMYVFIKSKNVDSVNPYFKINGQTLPYRILIAPWNEVLIKNNSDAKISICNVNKVWTRAYDDRDDQIIEWDDYDDENKERFENNIEINDFSIITKPTSANGVVKIKISGEGKANHKTSGGVYENEIVEIPYDSFENLYMDNWSPLFIGHDVHRDVYNPIVWENFDPNNITRLPNQDTFNSFDKVFSTTMVMMKYNTETNSFQFTGDWTINDNWEEFISRVWFMSHEGQDRALGIGVGWGICYGNGWKKGSGSTAKTFQWENVHVHSGGGANNWRKTYVAESSFEGPYQYLNKNISLGTFCLSGHITIIAAASDFSASYWYSTIKEIYQGVEKEEDNFIWNKESLIDYINEQYNDTDQEEPEVIISGKISSFNPIEIDTITGIPSNIYEKDSKTIPTPGSWNNNGVYEIFELNTDKAEIFNTYDLKEYKEKSWISGMNNYSIMIENNKEFEIKPEYVYSDGTFIHNVIPTPNEWTERIIFPNGIHNKNWEWINTKEFMFGEDALGKYGLNNPDAINNSEYNNNINLLKSGITLAASGVAAVMTGGTSVAVSAGLAAAGTNSAISNIQARKNLNHNITMMDEQPPITTGTGSAYSDLFLNNNGFGLTIVEWLYTTNNAINLIDFIVKYGIKFEKSLNVKFSNIKRPEFNYVKINNGIQAVNNINLNNNDKNTLSQILEKGTRLWYNYNNWLNFEVENNSLFHRKMINYIDWNNNNNNNNNNGDEDNNI